MNTRSQGVTRRGASTVELLLVFSLVVLFGITLVTLVFTGGEVYGRIVERKQAEGDARIAISYVNVLVRQSDAQGGVQVLPVGVSDRDGLALTLKGEGADYTRWVFYADGALWECITDPGVQPTLVMSQKIIEVDDYTVAWQPGGATLVQSVSYESAGQRRTLRMAVTLRSQAEGG